MRYVIVVCDDDEDLNSIEEAFVAYPNNFSIKTFRSAALLFSYLLELDGINFPCLIIINNYLPDIDSLNLLHEVKKDPVHKLIPVAIMAGFASEEAIKQYYLAGANCFYKKPMEKHEWVHMADCLITLFCRG